MKRAITTIRTRRGFRTIRILRGMTAVMVAALGFFPASGGNLYKNLKVAQADTLIRNHEGKGDLVILDVRSPGEPHPVDQLFI